MSIPQSVRASKAVAHAEHYEGEIEVTQLERLAANTAGSGQLHAVWKAGKDAAGHPRMQAHIDGSVDLLCQRCLKTYAWPILVDSQLRLVSSDDEAAEALEDCDPYEVHDDLLPLREMTEDEVLLALPLMPRCKTCENIGETTSSAPEPRGPNPFAALKKLKF